MNARNELNRCLFTQKTGGFRRMPVSEEWAQYEDICRGNLEAVRRHADSIAGALTGQLSNDPVRNALYHLVIIASDTAKACVRSGMGHDEAYTLAEIYIRKADRCGTYEDILELLRSMALDFTERMREIRKQPVISLHVRKCIDYIYEHLGEDLKVNSLAAYCGLNPSYLSRLFFTETGIHLKDFVLNARTDTAQNLLKYSELSYTDISVALGFSSQSSFICSFRRVTGTTPKKYREQHYVSKQ